MTKKQDLKEKMEKMADEEASKAKKSFEVLKDDLLLITLLKEIKKKVVANEDTVLALINKICLRLVDNANPTSSNVLISDDSGAGKDWIATNVCEMIIPKNKYHHKTNISDKLLNYWTVNGGFDGHVIHLEDPPEECIKSQSFKVRASGQNEVSIVHKGKAKHMHIEGKPVFIVTSLNANIDIEGVRRWDALRVDKSMRVTQLMKELYAKEIAGLINTEPDLKLRESLHVGLKRVTVKIPYATDIVNLLPNNLVIRTQIQKLFDYIKSSAALHQHDREIDDDGCVIANYFDYDYACFCFAILGDVFGMVLNKYEKEILEALSRDDSLTIKDLANRVTASVSRLYGNSIKTGYMDNMKEKGLIIQHTSTNPETNKEVSYYSLSGVISTTFNLKTSKNMPNADKSFRFKKLIDEINKMRDSEGLPRFRYSDENGITISFMENMMKRKKGDNKGLDEYE